jgi:hypothetical protein
MKGLEVRQRRLRESEVWIASANREFESFKNEVRRRFIPFIERGPRHPQKAMESLNLCVEKTIKSAALATGRFDYKDIERKYGHNSLKLCADILENIFKLPFAKVLADHIQGNIFQDSTKGRFLSYREAMECFENAKSKIYIDKNQELSDRAYQLATLPEKSISSLVKSMLRKYRRIKIAGFILRALPVKALIRYKISSRYLGERILYRLELRGFTKSQEIKDFFENGRIREILNRATEEDKLKVFKHGEVLMMFGWVLCALWVLSALTSPHGTLPRYPSKQDTKNGQKRRLAEDSYTSEMGIVKCIRKVGRLAGIARKELNNSLGILVDTFLFYEIKPGTGTAREFNN